MENIFIGRQAIYDKQLNVFAYELLSRSNAEHNEAFIGEHNANHATTIVMLNALTEIGLQQLVGNHPAFINLPYDFLIGKCKIPDLHTQLVIEVLEDIEVTDELINAVKKLSDSGYMIALDDFIYNEKTLPLVEIADIIKIDILQLDVQGLRDNVEKLHGYDVRLLAEKVETQEEYELCKELGFDYFQGYFFCKPKIVESQRAPANRMTIVNILAQLQDPDVQIEKLEELISQDLALSYRLLKYINSAAFALQREIDSVHHAIVMLGLNTIRNLANLMLLSKIDDKPHDLLVLAIIRARMCEELGSNIDIKMKDIFFTAGLFSVIDALMENSMEEIVSQLPLSTILKDALLKQEGIVGEALKCCIAFERADWENIQFQKLDEITIQKAYFDAVIWSNNAMTMVANE
ncbi:MAG: HDOD domain-containing protein [Gammaproteobacteria bacterium]|nr:HDOD domain-containing protein [Gammaproteobacteria bacterium]MCW8988367.1 HDOD domain-containing protein [Gammaproteobacteria bacterium]